jgi:hypothetical protein
MASQRGCAPVADAERDDPFCEKREVQREVQREVLLNLHGIFDGCVIQDVPRSAPKCGSRRSAVVRWR